MRINARCWILGLILLVSAFSFVYGFPGKGSVTTGAAEQFTNTNSGNYAVNGGNSTTADLNVAFQALNWIGFYGAINGFIALGDGTDTMYQWSFPFTNGGVYASTLSSINWPSVSTGTLASDIQISNDESETFTGLYNWSVGSINVNNAPSVQLYNSTGDAAWNEVSLDVTSGEVFATEIQKNGNCFNDITCDFELIVPGSNTQSTTYYFYIELE